MAAAMTPARQVAVLLLSIDRDAAAAVLRNLDDAHLDDVTRAMKELQDVAVDRRAVDAVQQEFVRRAQSGRLPLGDVETQSEEVLRCAFGPERAAEVVERAERQVLSKRPFRVFEGVDPQDLAALLEDEHPQVAAVFLAHLDPRKAGRVLAHAPTARRADLIRRIASLERTSSDVVQRVVDVMRRKVADLGFAAPRGEPRSWLAAAAAILNSLGGGERQVLDEIEEQDAGLAGRIRDEMFTIDDLATLDRRTMQRLLGEIDSRTLATALKAATPVVEQNVFRNLSRRAGALVAEERDELGPTPLSEVVAAQHTVLAALRALVERGDIRIGEPEEEFV